MDNIVHFGYDRGFRVESFEEGMVFLYENPQVRNVIFSDGWSSTELDNIPQSPKATPLLHLHVNFVPN